MDILINETIYKNKIIIINYLNKMGCIVDNLMWVFCKNGYVRAIAPVCVKYFIYISIKTYFFYFTQSLFQNTNINLSILKEISIKYSFFIHLLLFSLMIILFEFKLIFQETTKADGSGSGTIGSRGQMIGPLE